MRKVIRFFSIGVILSLSLLLLLSSCKGGNSSVSESSQKVLRLITWKGYAPKALVKKFEKETGIKVKVTYSNNEEMIAKLRATGGSGYDLAQPTLDRIKFAQEQYHIYQPIDYSKVNTNLILKPMLDAAKRISKVGDKVYAVPDIYGTNLLIVNKKMAPDANDWSALFNPKYAGHIAIRLSNPNPILVGTAFSMGYNPFALVLNNNIEAYKKLLDKVTQKLIDAKKYVKAYWVNGDTQKNLVLNGGVWVETGWDAIGWQAHKVNKDIDAVCPKSGALGWIDTFAIPAKSKNVEGAYKWINFILKPENAAYVTNHSGYMTVSKGAYKYLKKEIKENYERTYSPQDLKNIKWWVPFPPEFLKLNYRAAEKIKMAQ